MSSSENIPHFVHRYWLGNWVKRDGGLKCKRQVDERKDNGEMRDALLLRTY
jgi:hypothetical protein